MSEEEKNLRFPPELPTVEAPGPDDRKTISDQQYSGLIMGLLPGIILIFLGSIFALSDNGYLEGQWWQYFIVGLGVVILVESRLEYQSAVPRKAKISRLMSGVFLLIGGMLFLFDPNPWWPYIFIAAGMVLCVQFVWRRELLKRRAATKLQ
jgi:hypothetical protein